MLIFATFTCSIFQDFEANRASLLFYVPLDQLYFLPGDPGKSPPPPPAPVWSLLTPGTLVVIIDFWWCLFREECGFRIDDLRQIFILHSTRASGQAREQKDKGQGKRTDGDKDWKSPWGWGNEEALKVWHLPQHLSVGRDSSPEQRKPERLSQAQTDAAVGLVNLSKFGQGPLGANVGRLENFGVPVERFGDDGSRIADDSERYEANISKFSRRGVPVSGFEDGVIVVGRSGQEGAEGAFEDCGATVGGSRSDRVIVSEFGKGEDEYDMTSAANSRKVFGVNKDAQVTKQDTIKTSDNGTTNSVSKGWKSKSEKKVKKGKKSKW